jgi:hypothetical protein
LMIASRARVGYKQSCRWLPQSNSHNVAVQKRQNQGICTTCNERKKCEREKEGERMNSRHTIRQVRGRMPGSRPRQSGRMRRNATHDYILVSTEKDRK